MLDVVRAASIYINFGSLSSELFAVRRSEQITGANFSVASFYYFVFLGDAIKLRSEKVEHIVK